MSDGMGCKCGAYGDYECGCVDVDWRSAREVELEAGNAELKEALERYVSKFGNCGAAYVQALEALSAGE